MKVHSVYNFLFHPFSSNYPTERIALSVAANIALTVLTGGLYLIAFGIIQLKDGCKATHILPNNYHKPIDKINRVGNNRILQPSPLQPRSGFIGIEGLKNKQADHLQKLQALANTNQWQHLREHSTHPDSGFDWWMFPTDRASAGQGDLYKLHQTDVQALKKDPVFIANYRQGVELILLSWGWDASQNKDVSNTKQHWTNYQVRLGKMAHSLSLFQQTDLLASLKQFCHTKNIFPQLEQWIKNYLV